MKKDEIKQVMRETQKNFNLDQSTRNPIYKYLKYIDRYGEQTLLYFLDENDYCTASKLMSDYVNLQEIIEELNNKYEIVDDSNWKYTDNDKVYNVRLIEGEWFFTVYTKLKIDFKD